MPKRADSYAAGWQPPQGRHHCLPACSPVPSLCHLTGTGAQHTIKTYTPVPTVARRAAMEKMESQSMVSLCQGCQVKQALWHGVPHNEVHPPSPRTIPKQVTKGRRTKHSPPVHTNKHSPSVVASTAHASAGPAHQLGPKHGFYPFGRPFRGTLPAYAINSHTNPHFAHQQACSRQCTLTFPTHAANPPPANRAVPCAHPSRVQRHRGVVAHARVPELHHVRPRRQVTAVHLPQDRPRPPCR